MTTVEARENEVEEGLPREAELEEISRLKKELAEKNKEIEILKVQSEQKDKKIEDLERRMKVAKFCKVCDSVSHVYERRSFMGALGCRTCENFYLINYGNEVQNMKRRTNNCECPVTAENKECNFCWFRKCEEVVKEQLDIDKDQAEVKTRGDGVLSATLLNAQGIQDNVKLDMFHKYIYLGKKYNLVFVTETWLNKDKANQQIDPQGWYHVYRRDRVCNQAGDRKMRGGVLILVDKSLHLTVQTTNFSADNLYKDIEFVMLDLLDLGKSNRPTVVLRILLVYHSLKQGDGEEKSLIGTIGLLISSALRGLLCPFLIVGDPNCRCVDFVNKDMKESNVKQRAFLDLVIAGGFEQFIKEPTRAGNTPDVVLCNKNQIVLDCKVKPKFFVGGRRMSDHKFVDIKVRL